MTKLLSIVAVSLFVVSAIAQDSTVTTKERTKERMNIEREQWAGKVADELANLPEDIQQKCKMAKDRADALGRQIHAIKLDSLSTEEQKAAIKELIAAKKAEADARIKEAMDRLDEFKTKHKAEIEAASEDVKARIEAKKEELKLKRAEIEKKIAEKKKEIEDIVVEEVEAQK